MDAGAHQRHLSAIGICATSYADADSMTFYACASAIDPWQRAFRKGANRLLVIGVGDTEPEGPGLRNPNAEPTFGQMFGFMLDSLFMDQLHSDLELISSQNELPGVRRIDALVITPSQDVSEIARRHRHELPRALRTLLRTIGANNSAGRQLLSYLLFERGYTRELIALGHSDARARAEEIRAFLALEPVTRKRPLRLA